MTNRVPAFSTPVVNRQVILARRPVGSPLALDFARQDAPIPVPDAGAFLVRNLYLSADPVQRGWAANPAVTPLGVPMRALAVGIVMDSRNATIATGDIVYGFLGWQDYSVVRRADLLSHIRSPRAPLAAYAGALGMPGVTAWLALHDIAPPRPGQAVLVSTAAGAVGSIVGQIARAAGAHVVGLTGSDAKVARCLEAFGYHEAFNYKRVDVAHALASTRPEGFDTYFDNVGGPILDTAVRAMAKYGRIVQCGTAATPSWSPPPTGLRNEREILTRVLTWSGFYIFDHVDRFERAIEALSDMLDRGALHYDEDIENGLDRVPSSLETIFSGANSGKKLIYIGAD